MREGKICKVDKGLGKFWKVRIIKKLEGYGINLDFLLIKLKSYLQIWDLFKFVFL